ncbi:MAG TPA: hypothetical protein VIW24_12265 [Aldersonia sp.]
MRASLTSEPASEPISDSSRSGIGIQPAGPLGNLQMLGKLQGAMIKSARSWGPMWALDMATKRSLDIYLTTEDLPRLDNRVRVTDDKILVEWRPNNVEPHKELVRRVTRAVRNPPTPCESRRRSPRRSPTGSASRLRANRCA